MNHIHAHLTEFLQLFAAILGTCAATVLVYLADRVRRLYKATGENDPEMLAAAASNIRDEGFRLTKHLLIMVIGIVTIVMEPRNGILEERAIIVRWILILISVLMVAQSMMVWRDRTDATKRSRRRDRRESDPHAHNRRRTDKRL